MQNEKAFADEEEKKVGFIAEEVAKKQRDCEEDLVKAGKWSYIKYLL